MAGSRSHILVFPYPSSGHMTPLLNLTYQLAIQGLTITVVVSPQNLSLVTPLLIKHNSIKTLILSFPTHPNHSVGIENATGVPATSVRDTIYTLSELYDPIINWYRAHPSPPVLIISDKFLGWTYHLALQLNIPRIAFSPCAAVAVSIVYTQWRDLPKRIDSNNENEIIEFLKVPNSPKYPWWKLSPFYRTFVEGEAVSEFFKDGILGDIASFGLIINTFNELEGIYIEYLKKLLGHDRVWAVGPLFPPDDGFSKPVEKAKISEVVPRNILSWLDIREDNSVVYVCFGSQTLLTNKQMEMLASGLEKSKVNFIWSIKETNEGDYGRIPSGFEDRVAGRGLIMRGWVPQVTILKHTSVGVFMTHCGWNSVMEGIIGGVAFLAWPMGAEQFMNATLLIDELKVGIKVCEGAQTVPDSDHLAKVLADSVGENHLGERLRALALRDAALYAVKESGSSYKDLHSLVTSISINK